MVNPANIKFDFDADALRKKYREERDRRLRDDGDMQYVEIKGKLAHFADEDPYAEKDFTRAPLNDEVDVVVIGGGFSGLFAAARLKEAGFRDIRIIEWGGDFGGTWYWNRYPGAQCDIDSYCYLPLLEETHYIPKEKYSFAPEIFEHCQRIGRHYGLYDLACFHTRVQEMNWDEKASRWVISTNRGDAMRTKFVVVAAGLDSRPKLPGIPGLETFKGHMFHTSRWDFDYTGGDTYGNLDKLHDKKVAIIGTGATAIQCVPHLGRDAEHLYVFQRTPSSVDLRNNSPTDPEWAKSLAPGWQLRRRENFNDVVTGRPFDEDMVNDGWTDIFRNLASPFLLGGLSPEERGNVDKAEYDRLAELVDFEKMERLRARVDQSIADRSVAGKLKPWYRLFCKRPTFNDDYLDTFNRPNVTLVDTSGSRGVERITSTGLVADGVEYEVDCIIFSTGFERSTTFRRRVGFEVRGKAGESLFDHWGQGMRTFHGHSVHGFPNWFFIGASQNGVSVNYTSGVDEQAKHIAHILREASGRGATTVEASAAAETEWVATIRRLAGDNTFLANCTPGYFNNEGKINESVATFNGDYYAPGANAFNALLGEWRATGAMGGLELDGKPCCPSAPPPEP